ncbi:MAG: Na/Pi cotransporter family protein [Treponema sp.]|nr:Na/Pi cotransporter family protein [Candidatus Treponema equifaecale]
MILKLINFAGSLCFLLYGMKLMSDGIQKSAGQKLQSALALITGNRFVGLLTGCGLTMIIQSSGATTVMLVGFVNAGLVTLEQAVGVIFGANIGTTITAWIVALFGFNFKLETFAIPIFGLGYLFTIIKKIKKEGLGIAIMGFGMLFIGLGWLSATFKNSNDSLISFIEQIQGFGPLSIALAVFVGVFFTALIHSSSAMTAIVITVAAVEPSFWEFGAAMVIGSTMGSTIDSIMAAFGGKPNAKRTALIHVMFNCSASLLAIIFFQPFLKMVDLIVPGTVQENVTYHIAALNTSFKVIATIIFIPFVNQIAELTRHIIKDKPVEDDGNYHLDFNAELGAKSPEACVFRAHKEVTAFSENVVEMYDQLQTGMANFDKSFIDEIHPKIQFIENYCDQMEEQLTAYLVKCQHLHLSDEAKDNLQLMMQLVGEMESMADGCLSISIQIKKALERDVHFKQEDFDRLIPYFELGRQLLYFIHKNVSKIQKLTPEEFEFAQELEQQIDDERRALRSIARERLENGEDVRTELYYMDIIRQIEKIGDRCFDVAGNLR